MPEPQRTDRRENARNHQRQGVRAERQHAAEAGDERHRKRGMRAGMFRGKMRGQGRDEGRSACLSECRDRQNNRQRHGAERARHILPRHRRIAVDHEGPGTIQHGLSSFGKRKLAPDRALESVVLFFARRAD